MSSVCRLSGSELLWVSSGPEPTSKESQSKESYPVAPCHARGSPSVPMWLPKGSQLVCTFSTSVAVMCSLCQVINGIPITIDMRTYMRIHVPLNRRHTASESSTGGPAGRRGDGRGSMRTRTRCSAPFERLIAVNPRWHSARHPAHCSHCRRILALSYQLL